MQKRAYKSQKGSNGESFFYGHQSKCDHHQDEDTPVQGSYFYFSKCSNGDKRALAVKQTLSLTTLMLAG